MPEMKPCPFCGMANIKVWWDDHCLYPWKVCCLQGCVELQHSVTKEEAVRKWNTREKNWISVEDRLPEKAGHYLCSTYGQRFIACFHREYWLTDGVKAMVHHWMPLPEPPERTT